MNERLSTLSGFVAGGLAACGSVTITNPLEVVKTRLQLQGELNAKTHMPRIYTGNMQALRLIYTAEGFAGWQRGLGTAYCYQIALNGCRLGLYEPLRRVLSGLFLGDADRNNMILNMVCGSLCGMMGACIGSPFFLVKTRLQSYSPALPVGTQHKYRGALDGLRTIYRSEGLVGLFRGVDAAMLRTGAGSSVQLPLYYAVKQLFEKYHVMHEGLLEHITASACSGFGVCCVMHPFDTIM